MSSGHEKYIQRCFEIAKLGFGNTSPNPTVGSVIVHNDMIIGEGWHKQYGGPHAEVNAVKSVADKSLLKESTIYVSLEPCFHFSKTPPCVDLVLKHKIPKVVISCLDPNPIVSGNSVKKLRSNGVEVTTGILEQKGLELIKGFLSSQNYKRPYVILKWAESKDGFFAPIEGQLWLSNDLTKRFSHKLRVEADAILVGCNTVEQDNPKLNQRYWPIGTNPIRVIIDPVLKSIEATHLLEDDLATIIFNSKKQSIEASKEYIRLEGNEFDINEILQILNEKKVNVLLVEGGAKTINSFLASGLWSKAFIYTTDITITDGIKAPIIDDQFKSSQNTLGNNQITEYKNPYV